MKEKLFGIDSPLFRMMSLIGDLMLLNLMWLISSIPLITIGASTTALLYTGMRLARGRDGYVVKNYWKSFRQNFKQSTILFLILLVLGGGLGYAGWFWMNQDSALGRVLAVITVCLLIVYLIEILFVFATQARFANTIPNTMKNALIMGIQNFPLTLLCLVGVALLIGLNYTFFIANILTLVVAVGALGYVLGIFYNLAFRRYIPEEESREDDEWHIPDEGEEADRQQVLDGNPDSEDAPAEIEEP